MDVSVIINTVDRAALLEECLISLEQQSFQDFEVIVVNGPSSDHTAKILARYKDRIKIQRCEDLNLAKSRNIGIAASGGEVCAFIDDDSVAHPLWLERLMAPYRNPRVAAVGGFTFSCNGNEFQNQYTVCDRLGNPTSFQRIDPASYVNFPFSPVYPSLLGTNCSFRRADLRRIGGFDEVFAYMLEETDVCLRLNDLGYRIATVPDALVLHRYAPSHSRDEQSIPRSLLAAARSKAYFCLKHRRPGSDRLAEIAEIKRYADEKAETIRLFVEAEKITPAKFMRLSREIREGADAGIALGSAPASHMDWLSTHRGRGDFLPFPHDTGERRLRIILVSQGYLPADTAGIARWTAELAQGLVALGHHVHVITASADTRRVEYHEGVWVHRVPPAEDSGPASPVPLPTPIHQRALAVYNEALRIRQVWGADVVSAPIWDAEGLICTAHLDIPVITSLHTTYKLALPFKQHWRTDTQFRRLYVDKVIAAEQWLLENAPLLLANSKSIVAGVKAEYGIAIKPVRIAIVPHGVTASPPSVAVKPAQRGRVRFLFVGRMERRKGPDLLLAAMLDVLHEFPETDLHMVGEDVPGDPDFTAGMARLRARLETEGLGKRVIFYGYVPDRELLMHYRACDVFVAPSRFESFGLIAIEAMRFGKPVIASNAGGLGDIFRDGTDGLLFENEDVASLRAALIRAAASRDLRQQIGARAKETFLRKYTVELMAGAAAKVFLKAAFPREAARHAPLPEALPLAAAGGR